MGASNDSPIDVIGLDHIVLRVHDLAASCDFYLGLLGGTMERELVELGLHQVRLGAHLIDLVPVESPLGLAGGAPPAKEGRNVDHFAVALRHFDPPALRAHLEAHGVAPGEVAQRYGATGQGPSMYLTDPDGNVVELKGPPLALGRSNEGGAA